MTTTKYRTGMRMSLDEFLDIGETDGKWELDDGVLYVEPFSDSIDHQFVLMQFGFHITDYLNELEEPPAEFYHSITTVLSNEQQRIVEPDLVIILEENREALGLRWIEAPPDIVIEILSTLTTDARLRDLVYKRQIYAQASIREYWLTDPTNDTVTQLELRDGEYVERAVLGADDTLTTPLLPGLSIPLGDIFRHRRRPLRTRRSRERL